MKRLLVIGVILLIYGSAVGQNDFDIKYDKFKDTTTVTSPTMQVTGMQTHGLQFKLIGMYDGQKPTQPKESGLMIFSVADERQFSNDSELIFLINDERLKLGKMPVVYRDYKSGRYIEGLYLVMPLETIKRLANAKTLEGKVGPKEFRITAEHQETFKAFIKRFDSPQI